MYLNKFICVLVNICNRIMIQLLQECVYQIINKTQEITKLNKVNIYKSIKSVFKT